MTTSEQGDHLATTTSERGFDRYPAIPGAYGGEVQVYESSAASAPHVWLKATESPLHLTAENATQLAEQLLALVAGHYQNEAGEPRELKDGTTLKVGDLREAMDGLPDNAQMFVNVIGQGEDFAVKQAWASQQVPEGVKDWRTAGTVIGLEIHLGLFEEQW